MSARRIYLDNNATTRPLPEVKEAMLEAMQDSFANPSSAHSLGRSSKRRLAFAREQVAKLVGALDEQVIFTSGGTEANNQVFLSALQGRATPHIITTAVEHSSILKMCAYLEQWGLAEVSFLPVDSNGLVSLQDLEAAFTGSTVLVSIQWANNETGVLQDIPAIQALCKQRRVPFHTDAAQAVGKVRVDFSKLDVDYLTFTAHKIHGPQGIGALVHKNPETLHPILQGGGQEFGLRPGTENLPCIIGFGVAAQLRKDDLDKITTHLQHLRDFFERELLQALDFVTINGGSVPRICNTSNLRFSGVEGFALFAQLDGAGLDCSQSSACTNHRPEPSYVLRAMGLSEDEAYASVRFCFSQENDETEAQNAVSLIKRMCKNLR